MREKLEYLAVWSVVRFLGLLPRWLARSLCMSLGLSVYLLHGRLRRTGLRNLQIAFPQMPLRERKGILRRLFAGLGRQLAEVCLFPRYRRETLPKIAIYEGFENFEAAQARGKGVLFLTGHFGGWEVGAFAHSLYGYPHNIIVRDLDNSRVDALVRRYRTLHGNRTIDNRDFARALLTALRGNETVGILMDTNMTPPQGVFVDFFGVPACTASGLARVAMKTGAAVLPGFTVWDRTLRKYRIVFDPVLELVHTGDEEADTLANTQLFTSKLEEIVRRYPDQWLWIHRRWKTRPPGDAPVY